MPTLVVGRRQPASHHRIDAHHLEEISGHERHRHLAERAVPGDGERPQHRAIVCHGTRLRVPSDVAPAAFPDLGAGGGLGRAADLDLLAGIAVSSLALWVTDRWHGISPAWVALGAALLIVSPRVGALPINALVRDFDYRNEPLFLIDPHRAFVEGMAHGMGFETHIRTRTELGQIGQRFPGIGLGVVPVEVEPGPESAGSGNYHYRWRG